MKINLTKVQQKEEPILNFEDFIVYKSFENNILTLILGTGAKNENLFVTCIEENWVALLEDYIEVDENSSYFKMIENFIMAIDGEIIEIIPSEQIEIRRIN